ncbi:MAG: DUF512 domain-containing protein [Lachnospiraceae bacterium]|nr:DUF512 domain-containing protein [Lachnospiraceae bacterium]
MKENRHIVRSVIPGSIAEEAGIEPGDELISINGEPIEDIFDYQFLVEDEEPVLLLRKSDGEEWELDIEKDEDEEIGIIFENGLMDEYRSCTNKCIFCFIDQMPPGMRQTLYFKDDDSRLSFLQGNYVTLTNMSDHDIERIIKYRLEPINISFQTTNPELRVKMLNNRFAGESLKKAQILKEAGISMNGQIVLCKGVNDKEELERSIKDLTKLLPNLYSVSVVPVGLSKYRDGLYPLEKFTKEDAEEVIDLIHDWQDRLYPEYGTHFIHAADEFYVLAGRDVPAADTYDGYVQYENGVGMIRSFIDEFDEAFAELPEDESISRHVSLAGGLIMAPFIQDMTVRLRSKLKNVQAVYYPIVNEFFGEDITVSGLLTGGDIIKQLKGKDLGEVLYLPENLLRAGETVLLDDVTLDDIERALQVKINIVKSSGYDFVEKIGGLT